MIAYHRSAGTRIRASGQEWSACERVACVAGVERGRGNLGARESVWGVPFPFLFQRRPRRLVSEATNQI